jgi:hypothetical protein
MSLPSAPGLNPKCFSGDTGSDDDPVDMMQSSRITDDIMAVAKALFLNFVSVPDAHWDIALSFLWVVAGCFGKPIIYGRFLHLKTGFLK